MVSDHEDVIRSSANLVAALYRATLVRWVNHSRERRGVGELDRYGRRCLLIATLAGLTMVSCTTAIVANPPAPERPAARPVTLPRTASPDINPRQPLLTQAPTSSPAPVVVDEDDDQVHIDVHDDDDHPRKSDFCGRFNPVC